MPTVHLILTQNITGGQCGREGMGGGEVNEGNIDDLLCLPPMAATVKCSSGTAPHKQLHQTFTRWGLPHFYRWGHELRKVKCVPTEVVKPIQ